MLHLAGDVQALSTHVRSDCPQCELDSAKQRQDTIATMIPCLYSFLLTALRTLVAELVGAKPLHLLTQTVLLLKHPTGVFVAVANANLR